MELCERNGLVLWPGLYHLPVCKNKDANSDGRKGVAPGLYHLSNLSPLAPLAYLMLGKDKGPSVGCLRLVKGAVRGCQWGVASLTAQLKAMAAPGGGGSGAAPPAAVAQLKRPQRVSEDPRSTCAVMLLWCCGIPLGPGHTREVGVPVGLSQLGRGRGPIGFPSWVCPSPRLGQGVAEGPRSAAGNKGCLGKSLSNVFPFMAVTIIWNRRGPSRRDGRTPLKDMLPLWELQRELQREIEQNCATASCLLALGRLACSSRKPLLKGWTSKFLQLNASPL
eukprot:scaffold20291_cov18-Tisochrysis_lutea.AAC.2